MQHGNKQIVRAFFATIEAGRLDRFGELVHPEGLGAMQNGLAVLLAAVPDVKYTLHDVLAEGDKVAARWTLTGTHTGAFRIYPATGKTVTTEGHAMFTLRDGKIAHVAMLTDRLGFLEQVGMRVQ